MKDRYGIESLDVKEDEPDWYECVEQEARNRNEIELHNIKENTHSENCSYENRNLLVEAAVEALAGYSAPNPEEQIFNSMLKKGEESVAKGLHYIFQKCWTTGVHPEVFKQDSKVMLPKPGKTNYNTVRSYRPITLESVVGKVMERVMLKLVWKLEVEGGVAETQNAYR